MLKKFNKPLLVLPIFIFLLGIFTLYSISPERTQSQMLAFLLAIVLYGFFAFFDYSLLKYWWKYLYFFTLLMLIATFFLGNVVFGSARWLTIGGINLQPSELAKFTVIVGFAAMVSSNRDYLKGLKSIPKIVLFILPMLALVVIQPDLGTTLLILAVFVAQLLYAGFNKLYFGVGVAIFGIVSDPIWNFLQDYQQRRILVFLNPTLDKLGAGYNVIQSKIAVGSGGLLGLGFGRGTQSHLQFLPAYWTDFIFASYSEEWGFVGVTVLLVLFLLLFTTFIYIAYSTNDSFGSLIVIGCLVVFFGQFFINVGMNLGILPVTGIPLPLVSYGGSSMVVSGILLGLVQSVWVHRKV